MNMMTMICGCQDLKTQDKDWNKVSDRASKVGWKNTIGY